MSARVVILSGTSGVGKTPLIKSFVAQHPDSKIGIPVLYTSREARPIEKDGVDYFFRSEEHVKNLDKNRHVIAQTRHIWQAIDIEQLDHLVADNEIVIFDIYPTLVQGLFDHHQVSAEIKDNIIRIFMQPSSLDEIRDFKNSMGDVSMQEAAAAMAAPKLIDRAQQQGKELTAEVLRDIQIRANHAWEEILIGQSYDYIIVNHDGENSPHWKESPPAGQAGKTLEIFSDIIFSKLEGGI